MKKSLTFLLIAGLICSCANSKKAQNSDIHDVEVATSQALPIGMQLIWHDEFNDATLDTTKWWPYYFSSLDWFNKEAYQAFLNQNIPVADYEMTGHSILLKATDKLYPGAKRQISSIQTYNWYTGEDKMNDFVGGFIEARIRRSTGEKGDRVNLAFWFDSPGPDLKYYLEEGGEAFGTKGIRPRGQVFEFDMCEYITTEIVLHGDVDQDGEFQHNIGHHIHKGDFNNKWVQHAILWSPAGLKFYIDGKLIREWWDPKDIKSPNHAMNMFFGAYGIDGVSMEVDYVRAYQWQLEEGNFLPNSGFEYSDALFPWEGDGSINKEQARSGAQCLHLVPKAKVEQYIYLDYGHDYAFDVWAKGAGELQVCIDALTPVSGELSELCTHRYKLAADYKQKKLRFATPAEKTTNKLTVKLSLENVGADALLIDDLSIVSQRYSH